MAPPHTANSYTSSVQRLTKNEQATKQYRYRVYRLYWKYTKPSTNTRGNFAFGDTRIVVYTSRYVFVEYVVTATNPCTDYKSAQ